MEDGKAVAGGASLAGPKAGAGRDGRNSSGRLSGGGHGKSVSRYSVAHIAMEPSAIQHHAPIKIVILSDEHRGMAREWA
ncbi:hypothetical protein ELH73_28215 [Rhizobium leguminosarum]|uniref:Uncharacterized protein n=1 Tax=Rhizobium leguminosarum TaxID=384 RepID=A0ABD7PJP1_RHILE|nr:hypothetical protein ELI28_31710 [Rhizobium leguminosarum]TAV66790.1 hypothetical protein ELI27_24610 [Rhizobium leguminosarum]TAW24963.1 hypothetical protein ELI19_25995 [Rhizobium leguminosarum]TAW38735.1 hypothetical protein ELI18_25965 [Rhizobium leguminosarum]TAX26662.1 hypothetical protein ELI06_26375 [Rhizobium leguminosarum]